MTYTKKQLSNLIKLADHLDSLPDEYDRFYMGTFYQDQDYNEHDPHELINKKEIPCGSCACAVGHGPSAGIRIYKDQSWDDYSLRVFGVDLCMTDGDYMFGPEWNDDPKAAAARIREVVSRNA
jgi:hypothetical protein